MEDEYVSINLGHYRDYVDYRDAENDFKFTCQKIKQSGKKVEVVVSVTSITDSGVEALKQSVDNVELSHIRKSNLFAKLADRVVFVHNNDMKILKDRL